MAGVTFSEKALRLTVTLDKAGANNVYTLTGFATHVAISKQGGVDFAKASVEVYGLSLDTMAQLTMLSFRPLGRRWNLLQVEAGEGGNYSVVFQGEVTNAYADLNGACPVMKMEAQTGSYPVLQPEGQLAISGQQSAAETVGMLAQKTGKTFRNDGVEATLSDCIITGDPITKMRQIANSVGADLLIDDDEIVLLPRGKERDGRDPACLRRRWDGRVPDVHAERHSSRFVLPPRSPHRRGGARRIHRPVRFGHLEDRQSFPRPNGTQARRRFVAHNVRGDVAR